MNVQQVSKIVSENGLTSSRPGDVKEAERFVLTIEADHNDADYRTETTVFKVNENFDLVELLNVLKVLRKLQQVRPWTGKDDNWHIAPMFHKLSDEDIKILFDYESKRNEEVVDLEEYTLLDMELDMDDCCSDGDIPYWFPDVEFCRAGEGVNGNHSLISIKLQYNDGNRNLLNIEL